MGMSNKNMIDLGEFAKTEFAHPGTGVDQHITIKQKRRGAKIAPDSAAASQYSKPHNVVCVLIIYRVIWSRTRTRHPTPQLADYYGSRQRASRRLYTVQY